MEFQHRLYDLRRKAGLSQEGLADLIGVTRQAVQKWEAGSSRPDMDNLVALSQYFHVTLDWLITGQETVSQPDAPVVVEKHFHYIGWHYEYKSRKTWRGLPLVHINLAQRGLCRAKGVVAVGNVATGLVAVGCFSLGLFSVGALGVGALTLGAMGLGVLSVGGIAVGAVAAGGCAIGWLALGGSALGVYAVGGAAAASKVAVGGSASAGLLAIGREASGEVVLALGSGREVMEQEIARAASGAPKWLRELLLLFGQL